MWPRGSSAFRTQVFNFKYSKGEVNPVEHVDEPPALRAFGLATRIRNAFTGMNNIQIVGESPSDAILTGQVAARNEGVSALGIQADGALNLQFTVKRPIQNVSIPIMLQEKDYEWLIENSWLWAADSEMIGKLKPLINAPWMGRDRATWKGAWWSTLEKSRQRGAWGPGRRSERGSDCGKGKVRWAACFF
jgi:hypothetical protein